MHNIIFLAPCRPEETPSAQKLEVKVMEDAGLRAWHFVLSPALEICSGHTRFVDEETGLSVVPLSS